MQSLCPFEDGFLGPKSHCLLRYSNAVFSSKVILSCDEEHKKKVKYIKMKREYIYFLIVRLEDYGMAVYKNRNILKLRLGL